MQKRIPKGGRPIPLQEKITKKAPASTPSFFRKDGFKEQRSDQVAQFYMIIHIEKERDVYASKRFLTPPCQEFFFLPRQKFFRILGKVSATHLSDSPLCSFQSFFDFMYAKSDASCRLNAQILFIETVLWKKNLSQKFLFFFLSVWQLRDQIRHGEYRV